MDKSLYVKMTCSGCQAVVGPVNILVDKVPKHDLPPDRQVMWIHSSGWIESYEQHLDEVMPSPGRAVEMEIR